VLYGVATLRTGSKNAQGEPLSVGSMVKIEINIQQNAFRVSIRTLYPAASTAIVDTIKSLYS
jgi:hypothetical protein